MTSSSYSLPELTHQEIDANSLLQKTFDSLNEAVFIVQTGTRVIQDVNKAVEHMFGYTRDEIIGASTTILHLNDELSQLFGSEMLKAYDEKGFYETTFQMMRKDRTIFDSEHCVTPLHDDHGRVVYHICVVRDISERVRAESILSNTTLELSAILENSCVGITFTKNRNFVRANNRFEEMFGYAKGELEGKSVRVVYPNNEAFQKHGREAYTTVAQGLVYETELELIRKDGSIFWAKFYGRAIEPSNLSSGTIWVVEDISKRKYAEARLEEKTRLLEVLNNSLEERIQKSVNELMFKEQLIENQNRLLIELAPEAIIVLNVGLGKIVNANPRAEKLFGCCKTELFTLSPLDFYTGQQPDGLPPEISFRQYCKRVMQGEVVSIERSILNRQNVKLTCEVNLVLLPSKDKQLVRATFVDITERNRIQLELANALDIAQKVNEEQRQFIGLISHELRTPLSIIDGAAQLLQMSACPDSDCLRQADRIRAASIRLTRLFDTCLTEERLSSSGWNPDFQYVLIRELITDVTDLYQKTSDFHTIFADIKILPDEMYCDATLIKLLIGNLIENAIKYSPQGGVIQVQGACGKQKDVYIDVSDHGIGFAPEHMDKIFDRFYRTWQMPDVPGAGLGLYLVKKIAELHGGSVSCKSAPGQGSTFSVCLHGAP